MINNFMQSLANSLPLLISYVGRDEKYQFANLEYKKWFGLDPEYMIGKTLLNVLGNNNYQKIKDCIPRILTGESIDYEVYAETIEDHKIRARPVCTTFSRKWERRRLVGVGRGYYKPKRN